MASAGGISHTVEERRPHRLIVRIRGAGENPCTPAPGVLVPDIDYDGRLLIDTSGGRTSVAFLGAVDDFPAFEMYAVHTGEGTARTLFRSMPSPGNTPADLFGPPRQRRRGFVRFQPLMPCHRRGPRRRPLRPC
jgi:hypothetical protein